MQVKIPLKAERRAQCDCWIDRSPFAAGITNRFRGEPTQSLMLTHIVVDDQVVDLCDRFALLHLTNGSARQHDS